MKEIEQLRKVFLSEVDEDMRRENEEQIREWEQSLIHNEALLTWQEHDITKAIVARAKETYREIAKQLATNRTITDAQRQSFWAQQDAMTWILSLAEADPKAVIKDIHQKVKAALNATS